jgi:hypothetical protein
VSDEPGVAAIGTFAPLPIPPEFADCRLACPHAGIATTLAEIPGRVLKRAGDPIKRFLPGRRRGAIAAGEHHRR